MTTIAADVARWLELESEIEQMRHRIAQRFPDRPRYSAPELALDGAAQAASGCKTAARYLRQAAREAMGGES